MIKWLDLVRDGGEVDDEYIIDNVKKASTDSADELQSAVINS